MFASNLAFFARLLRKILLCQDVFELEANNFMSLRAQIAPSGFKFQFYGDQPTFGQAYGESLNPKDLRYVNFLSIEPYQS
jgi:hypothetical protein